MKALFFAVLMVVTTTCFASTPWLKIDSDGNGTTYVNTALVRHKGKVAGLVAMHDFVKAQRTASGQEWKSIITFSEFDCQNHKYKIDTIGMYTGQMGSGNGSVVVRDKPEWTPVVKGSSGESMWRLACVYTEQYKPIPIDKHKKEEKPKVKPIYVIDK